MQAKAKYAVSGALAGAVNGLFGGGGGMVLVPLLSGWCGMEGKRSFATCVAVILPLSAVSAAVYLLRQGFELAAALPYLLGLLWKTSNSVTAQAAPECIEKAKKKCRKSVEKTKIKRR